MDLRKTSDELGVGGQLYLCLLKRWHRGRDFPTVCQPSDQSTVD